MMSCGCDDDQCDSCGGCCEWQTDGIEGVWLQREDGCEVVYVCPMCASYLRGHGWLRLETDF